MTIKTMNKLMLPFTHLVGKKAKELRGGLKGDGQVLSLAEADKILYKKLADHFCQTENPFGKEINMRGLYIVEVVPYKGKKKGKFFLRPKAPNGRILNHEFNTQRSAIEGARLMLRLTEIRLATK